MLFAHRQNHFPLCSYLLRLRTTCLLLLQCGQDGDIIVSYKTEETFRPPPVTQKKGSGGRSHHSIIEIVIITETKNIAMKRQMNF